MTSRRSPLSEVGRTNGLRPAGRTDRGPRSFGGVPSVVRGPDRGTREGGVRLGRCPPDPLPISHGPLRTRDPHRGEGPGPGRARDVSTTDTFGRACRRRRREGSALLHWASRRRIRETSTMRSRSHPRPRPAPSSAFAGYRFPPEVITLPVRWYLRFGLSYRDVEELLAERGI